MPSLSEAAFCSVPFMTFHALNLFLYSFALCGLFTNGGQK